MFSFYAHLKLKVLVNFLKLLTKLGLVRFSFLVETYFIHGRQKMSTLSLAKFRQGFTANYWNCLVLLQVDFPEVCFFTKITFSRHSLDTGPFRCFANLFIYIFFLFSNYSRSLQCTVGELPCPKVCPIVFSLILFVVRLCSLMSRDPTASKWRRPFCSPIPSATSASNINSAKENSTLISKKTSY